MRSPRGLQALVDEHVQRWDIARRTAPGSAERSPCIALSRLPGSGGAEIGLETAERLGYAFFGIEIVDRIAREQHVRRSLVAGLDEHVRGAIDRYVIDAFRSFTESDYLRHVVHTITTLGEGGGAVILGRGAAFILPPARALRVLVVAPRATRLERLAKSRNLGSDEALYQLEREEADRREFHRHHFGVDPDDPNGYDLVVNAGTLGIDLASTLMVESLSHRFPARR